MWRPPDALSMTEEQRKTLERWIRARTTPQRMVLRPQICLLAADGRSNNEEFIRLNNQNPRPFVWTKKVDEILEKANHCKVVVETLH